MNTKSNLWYLANANLKSIFCPNIIQQGNYNNHPAPRTYKKGEFIYFPSENANKVYYIDEGRIKIGAYSNDGKEIIKAVLRKGEIFGELSLVGETQRTDFAQAMNDTMLCVMPVSLTQELMAQNKDFSLQITKLIGFRLIKTQRRLESLMFKDARSRIIEFLCDLANDNGQRVGYEMLVKRFFTHQEIANITGTSRQTVTTTLNQLREQNLIHFDRKKLLIRDLKKLGSLVEPI